jgi:hypothetical protein
MHQYSKSIITLLLPGWLWLLVSCTPATGIEPGGNTESDDTAATGDEPTDAKPTDIIDRMFSPLDNAVSDINRDLNKGDADTPPEPNE